MTMISIIWKRASISPCMMRRATFSTDVLPQGFSGASTLIMDQMQQVGSGQDFWYVYDYCQSVDGYGNLWIRGVASHSRSDSILRIITNAALILLPFFVALIALGGYLITAKALRPCPP